MSDFETHPVGTAARLAEAERLLSLSVTRTGLRVTSKAGTNVVIPGDAILLAQIRERDAEITRLRERLAQQIGEKE